MHWTCSFFLPITAFLAAQTVPAAVAHTLLQIP